MRELKIESIKGTDNTDCLLVNDRYQIYLDNGCVYDIEQAEDIPQFVFEIRDIVLCVKKAGYRKQSEGEWSRFEVNSTKGYGQVYYQHKDCDINATQLFPSPYHFCPNCGAKMKGGAE